MSYEELYKQAVEAGAVDALNVTIIKWESDGQRVVGEFVRCEVLADSAFDVEVQKYIVKSDQGLVSYVLGSAADKDLVPKLQPGDFIAVTFRGKKKISDGRSVNMFDIQSFGKKGAHGKAKPAKADNGAARPDAS